MGDNMTAKLANTISSEPVLSASRDADSLAALTVLGADGALKDPEAVTFSAYATEIVALRLAQARDNDAITACREAFELLRAVLQDDASRTGLSALDISRIRTRTAAFGVLGEMHAQTRQLLASVTDVASEVSGWGASAERYVLAVWQLLIRKRGWADLDQLRKLIDDVRDQQAAKEPLFLEHQATASDGWRLVVMYHLLRAAEIIAEHTEHGSADGHFDPTEQAELHFDRARDAAIEARDADLSFFVALLDLASRSLVERSIWSAVRGAGSRARSFVEQLASRGNEQPFLELLPPQHKALVDEGLMGAGRRSIVVSLPTSAGKTLIAEFRILQALDNYDKQLGWVAYTAPTRALVNQVTARLRRDFAPLGIRVERFSPALEVDSVEAEILSASNDPFRVIVTTPEKLDLLLRGGWASDLGRPLCLVIVDEAHNLRTGARGLKLELLLATINREEQDASFLLMTPFIPNAAEIASWLDPSHNQAVELGVEWLPNDRVVGLAKLERASPRGNSRITAEAVLTSAPSLHTEQTVELAEGRPFGLAYSKLKSSTTLATATALALSQRGSTVTLVGQPSYSWKTAERLADSISEEVHDDLAESIGKLLEDEYGREYPLTRLLKKGVAVHHAGLSDDVRLMIEALAERGALRHIVATTTLAQGINFPISNVVLGSYKYPFGTQMPTEDFWNIAGRAGRVNHGEPGVVLLAAHDATREEAAREYLSTAATNLNSTLVEMVEKAINVYRELNLANLSFMGDWSSFVQFITHTYRVVGAEEFSTRVEQILRGMLGFRELREHQPAWADALVHGVQRYTSQLTGKPISLVDSTGFSWESVNATLARMHNQRVGEQLLDDSLFAESSTALSDAIGVLLQIPELREQLVERLDSSEPQCDFLSRVLKDWVGGMPLGSLADRHFASASNGSYSDHTQALTRCCQRLFGSILPTTSWGLSALQTLAMTRISDTELKTLARDLPSYVYYGVNTREAVALRLMGVPRVAARALALHFCEGLCTDELRRFLMASTPNDWTEALGEIGHCYYDAWRLIEPAA